MKDTPEASTIGPKLLTAKEIIIRTGTTTIVTKIPADKISVLSLLPNCAFTNEPFTTAYIAAITEMIKNGIPVSINNTIPIKMDITPEVLTIGLLRPAQSQQHSSIKEMASNARLVTRTNLSSCV